MGCSFAHNVSICDSRMYLLDVSVRSERPATHAYCKLVSENTSSSSCQCITHSPEAVAKSPLDPAKVPRSAANAGAVRLPMALLSALPFHWLGQGDAQGGGRRAFSSCSQACEEAPKALVSRRSTVVG